MIDIGRYEQRVSACREFEVGHGQCLGSRRCEPPTAFCHVGARLPCFVPREPLAAFRTTNVQNRCVLRRFPLWLCLFGWMEMLLTLAHLWRLLCVHSFAGFAPLHQMPLLWVRLSFRLFFPMLMNGRTFASPSCIRRWLGRNSVEVRMPKRRCIERVTVGFPVVRPSKAGRNVTPGLGRPGYEAENAKVLCHNEFSETAAGV